MREISNRYTLEWDAGDFYVIDHDNAGERDDTDTTHDDAEGALDDDQIPSVLPYVWREWGHTGAPGSVEGVGEVRGLTKTRTRPWTDAELTPAGRGRGGRGP